MVKYQTKNTIPGQITESNHPLISQWLKDNWQVAQPKTTIEQSKLKELRFEPSTILLNTWIKIPDAN